MPIFARKTSIKYNYTVQGNLVIVRDGSDTDPCKMGQRLWNKAINYYFGGPNESPRKNKGYYDY